MRIGLPFLLAAVLGSPLVSPAADTNGPAVFRDDREKAGYALGLYFANQLTNVIKRNNFDVDTGVVLGTMNEIISGRPVKMTEMEAQIFIRAYQVKRQQETVDKNTRAGEAFMANIKDMPGVQSRTVTLPEGPVEFLYKVLQEGSGDLPKTNDVVNIRYRGTFINGTEFDSTEKQGGDPLSFPLNGNAVIRGMLETVKLMKVGSKWQAYFPPALAYRDRPMGVIEPGSTLVFEIELVSAEPPKPPPPPPPPPTGRPLTSEIIRVPSAAEIKAGQKPERIDPKELERQAAAQNSQSTTNKK